MRADEAAAIAQARGAIRLVERFGYAALVEAADPDAIRDARLIMRLAIGLRRRLDVFTVKDNGNG